MHCELVIITKWTPTGWFKICIHLSEKKRLNITFLHGYIISTWIRQTILTQFYSKDCGDLRWSILFTWKWCTYELSKSGVTLSFCAVGDYFAIMAGMLDIIHYMTVWPGIIISAERRKKAFFVKMYNLNCIKWNEMKALYIWATKMSFDRSLRPVRFLLLHSQLFK